MERLLDRLTKQLKTQGYPSPRASAIDFLRTQGSMEKDSLKLTEHRKNREKMTRAERAIDRACKSSGRHPEDYEYDSKTNKVTLKYGV